MTKYSLEELKYPIGQFKCPEIITNNHISNWIKVLEEFPEQLNNLVKHLNNE